MFFKKIFRMKIKFSALIPLGIFCIYFFSNCTPQLAEPLKKIQDTQYSTSWERLTSYPIPNGRSDDLHFFDAQTGFVINSNGYLSHTDNGGDTWETVSYTHLTLPTILLV